MRERSIVCAVCVCVLDVVVECMCVHENVLICMCMCMCVVGDVGRWCKVQFPFFCLQLRPCSAERVKEDR